MVSARARVSSEVMTGEGICFQAHVDFGKIYFLGDCWTQGLSSLLVVGQRPPLVPFHVGLSIYSSLFDQSQQERESIELGSKMEVITSGNVSMEVVSWFCFGFF